MRRISWGLVALTLLVTQSCGSVSSRGSAGPGSLPTVVPAAAEPLLPSPLQKYRLTPTELAAVEQARGTLIRRCMQKHGLDYPQAPFARAREAAVESERVALGRIYGITDPLAASQHGYGFSLTDGRPDDVPRNRAYLQILHGDLDPRGHQSPTTQPGGCVGQADRSIGRTDQDVSVYGLAHTLWIDGNRRLLASHGYATVARAWVSCMRTRGYDVTDPLADRGAIAAVLVERRAAGDDALTGPPVPGEIQLAQADVACKRDTGLVARLDRLSDRIDARTITTHRRELVRDRHRLDCQVDHAVVLLDSDPDVPRDEILRRTGARC